MTQRRTKTDPERWAAASAAFDALCDLDADAQARRLAEIARGDAALAAEVRALLAADAAEDDLFDAGLAGRSDTVRASLAAQGLAPAHAPGLQPGATLAAYRLDARIGQGGMGEVWRATRAGDESSGPVALKLLRPGMDSEDLVRRFALERRILERLEHPGIARLLDAGTAANGQPWLAVEYIDGTAIDRYARAHALDVASRVALIAAVCDAVDFAHRRLIVHRDLKPTNVLVDAQGRTHLLDFGIAKLMEDEPGADRLTQTGVRAFSPAYAAPEQLLGEPVTTATDVYALGLVLFELLTGQLPHQRARKTGAPVQPRDPVRETIEAPSVVLRRASAAQVDAAYGSAAASRDRAARAIAGDLDTIVMSALRREPERRYASATALADDLRRYLDGLPISARRDSWRYRARMFVRRNRVGVIAAGIVLASLVAGIAATTWQARVAQREAARADAQAREARAAAARAESTREALVAMFRASGPDQAGNPAISVHEVLQEGRRAVEEGTGDPLARADLAEALARVHLASGMAGEALRLAREALRLRETAGVRDLRATRLAQVTLARALAASGERDEALALLTPLAASIRDTPIAELRESQVRMAMELATPLAQLDRGDDAATLLAHVGVAVVRRGVASRQAAELTARTAELARDAGDFPRALAAFATLFPNEAALADDATPERMLLAGRYADVLVDAGEPRRALAIYRQILAVERDLYAGVHPHVLETLLDVGGTELQLGERALLARTRDDLIEFAPSGSTAAARARLLDADVLAMAGDTGGALAAYDQAIALLDVNLGANHPLVWSARARRAALAAVATDSPTALAELDAARAPLVAAFGEHHVRVVRFAIDAGLARCARGSAADVAATITGLQGLLATLPEVKPQRDRAAVAVAIGTCALRRGGDDALALARTMRDEAIASWPAGLDDTAAAIPVLALRARLAQADHDAGEARAIAARLAAMCARLDAAGLAGCAGAGQPSSSG